MTGALGSRAASGPPGPRTCCRGCRSASPTKPFGYITNRYSTSPAAPRQAPFPVIAGPDREAPCAGVPRDEVCTCCWQRVGPNNLSPRRGFGRHGDGREWPCFCQAWLQPYGAPFLDFSVLRQAEVQLLRTIPLRLYEKWSSGG